VALDIVAALTGAAVGAITGAVGARLLSRKKDQLAAEQAQAEAETIRQKARAEAEHIRKDAQLAAKDELMKLKEESDKRLEGDRAAVRDRERSLQKKDQALDEREGALEKRQRMLSDVETAVAKKQEQVRERETELDKILEEQKAALTRTAQMTVEEARSTLLEKIRVDVAEDETRLIAKSEERIRATADERSKDILSTAIQRVAADHASEITVSVIDLPNDEVKGRIIGREGRNIRAFEKASGVDVVVDDTPGVIVVSAFDGVRRETARRAMLKLIKDGRIHPSRIEEIVKETQSEMEADLNETGKQAVLDTNVGQMHPKLVHLLGRLKYRTSYGQNVLQHSIEAGELCAAIASELGLKPRLAKRCGLLHDIGKAIDHEVEGGHPAIGADIARRCGEDPIVVNAIAAHHEDVRMETSYAVLTAASDAISAARPGARRDTLERYVQRLQKLEEIASRYEGVDHAYAIQAGREIRVMVNPTKIGDRTAQRLAREIAKSIENELTYPGEVKVTLVRETRVTDYAR
jgi:ribonuclease Y